MDVHYCRGKVEKVQLFGTAECEMMPEIKKVVVSTDECCQETIEVVEDCHKDSSVDQSKCCYNETIIVDVTDDTSQYEFSDVDFQQVTFLTYFILSSYTLFFAEEVENDFHYYSPPLISKDISTLNQVFII